MKNDACHETSWLGICYKSEEFQVEGSVSYMSKRSHNEEKDLSRSSISLT